MACTLKTLSPLIPLWGVEFVKTELDRDHSFSMFPIRNTLVAAALATCFHSTEFGVRTALSFFSIPLYYDLTLQVDKLGTEIFGLWLPSWFKKGASCVLVEALYLTIRPKLGDDPIFQGVGPTLALLSAWSFIYVCQQ